MKIHNGDIHNDVDWMADWAMHWHDMVARRKVLDVETKLDVVWVWIIYNPRWTTSFNTLTGLLIKTDAMNYEKTHVFLPRDRSFELCQTKQQDNVVFDLVEVSSRRAH